MLKMSQVTSIREQWSEGKTISEIARAVSVDRNTVYKYTQMTDFSKAVALLATTKINQKGVQE